jgi:hypothetical protein
LQATLLGPAKLWVPHPNFGIRYGGFYGGANPLIKVAMTPEPNIEHVHNFNIDFLIKKCSRRLLECE